MSRRHLPSIDRLLAHEALRACGAPRQVVADAARAIVSAHRDRMSETHDAPSLDEIAAEVRSAVALRSRSVVPRVINATGVVLHTGLGRAPLPAAAAEAIMELSGSYAPVEIEVGDGTRGRRARLVEGLLTELTGAEAATVMNNNAAATLVTLSAMAEGRRAVIVSRGELVEIGGSFRLPDVMEAGGATLREVGTTNRTRLADYERAIDERAAALLKVHPSNYRVEGFTEEVAIEELVALGRRHGIAVIHDIGSGALDDLSDLGLHGEPTVRASIAAGADVVLFSGDKLLGGPQAGIAVGTARCIQRIESHPLMRAVRTGKLTLAALGATLQQHRDKAHARRAIPTYALLAVPVEALERRARAIADQLRADFPVTVERTEGYAGGGSVPQQAIESAAVVLAPAAGEAAIAGRLRAGAPPVFCRLDRGRVVLDLRTVNMADDPELVMAVQAACQGAPANGHAASHID